jgi:hypothetical protein
MALLPPIKLSGREKLEILQRLDRFRKWRSLDEKRYCLACGKIITGREIEVVGGTRGTGPLRIICPTRGCHSISMDWVLPTDEVLAKMSASKPEQRVVTPKQRCGRRENPLASGLRKLAIRLRRAA